MRIGKFELRGIIIITENDAIGLQKSEALNHFRMLQILANATANLANGCECKHGGKTWCRRVDIGADNFGHILEISSIYNECDIIYRTFN